MCIYTYIHNYLLIYLYKAHQIRCGRANWHIFKQAASSSRVPGWNNII